VSLDKFVSCLGTLGIPHYISEKDPSIVLIPYQHPNGEPYFIAATATTDYDGKLTADYLSAQVVSKVPNLADKVMHERHSLTPGVKYIYVRKRRRYAVEGNMEFANPEKDPLILLLRLHNIKMLMNWREHDKLRSKDAPSRK
jgi:hypothetical protein